MNPTNKAPAIENFIMQSFGVDRRAMIQANRCVACGNTATHFKDELSRKEYSISGMCQKCQDAFYGEDDD